MHEMQLTGRSWPEKSWLPIGIRQGGQERNCYARVPTEEVFSREGTAFSTDRWAPRVPCNGYPAASSTEHQQRLPETYSNPSFRHAFPSEVHRESASDPDRLSDVQKKKLLATSFDNYAIVSALIFGFACSAVSWSYKDYLKQKKSSNTFALEFFEVVYALHLCFMAICSSIAMFSTLVFSLHGIYTRVAISNDNLPGLNMFLNELQPQRDCAFRSFIAAAAMLPTDIVMCTYVNLKTYGFETLHVLVILMPVVIIAGVSSLNIVKLIRAAGRYIFRVPQEETKSNWLFSTPAKWFSTPPMSERSVVDDAQADDVRGAFCC